MLPLLTEAESFDSTEKTFTDLAGDNGYPLRYDFYIEFCKEKILIEYDGEQHFHPVEFFVGQERFIKQKEYDYQKDKYAFDNNIPLLRFDYTQTLTEEFIEKQIMNVIKNRKEN